MLTTSFLVHAEALIAWITIKPFATFAISARAIEMPQTFAIKANKTLKPTRFRYAPAVGLALR
jgi:hypothetical protein